MQGHVAQGTPLGVDDGSETMFSACQGTMLSGQAERPVGFQARETSGVRSQTAYLWHQRLVCLDSTFIRCILSCAL